MRSSEAFTAAREYYRREAFLRTPPFPWVDPRRGAVSKPGATAIGDAALERLLADVSTARVGGTFWASRPSRICSTVACTSLSRAASQWQERRQDVHFVARTKRDAWQARGLGFSVVSGCLDPWALTKGVREIHAAPWEPIALTGWLQGATVIVDGQALQTEVMTRVAQVALASACYRDPFNDEPASVDWVIAQLADWRALLERNLQIGAVAGVSWWKRTTLRRFLWNGNGGPVMVAPTRAIAVAARRGQSVAIWPSRVPSTMRDQAAKAGVPVTSIEDGFIRSAGLGSDLVPPLSIVADRTGIYFDPSTSSDLEKLLAEVTFSPALLDRARRLTCTVLEGRVAKYMSGTGCVTQSLPKGRRRVLVVGQVDDDLSVQRAGQDLCNRSLIAAARREEPSSYLIYKPHPDVEAGHRRGYIPDEELAGLTDRVDRTGGIIDLIEQVDAVHVLTSLSGFEALLRGREVIVHGQPFYAGWGLTRDLAPQPLRRGRSVDLTQLVAAAYILYPRYLDPITGLPCPPEILVNRLIGGMMPTPGPMTMLRRLQGWLRNRVARR